MDTVDPPDRPLPAYLSKLPVGVERLSPDLIAAHRRSRISTASIEVFAERGFRATTIDLLAAAAHVGVGSFYALFDGKQGCFLHAYDTIIDTTFERIAAALPAESLWPVQARVALEALLKWAVAEPLAARLVLIEAQTAGPAAVARYQATLERLALLLNEGRAHSPAGSALPASFEYATVTGVAWLLQEWLLTSETRVVEALLPDLVEIVADPYLESEIQTIPVEADLKPGHRSAAAEAGAFLTQAGTTQ